MSGPTGVFKVEITVMYIECLDRCCVSDCVS